MIRQRERDWAEPRARPESRVADTRVRCVHKASPIQGAQYYTDLGYTEQQWHFLKVFPVGEQLYYCANSS